MSKNHEYIKQLESQPCECIPCPSCINGDMWRTIDGQLHKHRCDDMGDTESCIMCDGSGLTEVCDRCRELESAYSDEGDVLD